LGSFFYHRGTEAQRGEEEKKRAWKSGGKHLDFLLLLFLSVTLWGSFFCLRGTETQRGEEERRRVFRSERREADGFGGAVGFSA
jgi:hypothetical protein